MACPIAQAGRRFADVSKLNITHLQPSGKGKSMPTINVQLFEGRTPEQKKAFVKAITEVTCQTLDSSPESVDIIIAEVKRENWATGGKLWSE
jgi:4-oxalocrotonate tautomerase